MPKPRTATITLSAQDIETIIAALWSYQKIDPSGYAEYLAEDILMPLAYQISPMARDLIR